MYLFYSEDAGRVSACGGRPTVPFISAFHLLFSPTSKSATKGFTSSLSGLLPIIIFPVISALLSLLAHTHTHTHLFSFFKLMFETTTISNRKRNQWCCIACWFVHLLKTRCGSLMMDMQLRGFHTFCDVPQILRDGRFL